MGKYNLLKVVKLKTGKKKYRIVIFNVETQRENTIEIGQRTAKDYTIYYKEEGYILKGIKIEKIGLLQVLILLVFGRDF